MCSLLSPSTSSAGSLTGSLRQVFNLFVCTSSAGFHSGSLRQVFKLVRGIFVNIVCWIPHCVTEAIFFKISLFVRLLLDSTLGHRGNPTLIHSHTKSKNIPSLTTHSPRFASISFVMQQIPTLCQTESKSFLYKDINISV